MFAVPRRPGRKPALAPFLTAAPAPQRGKGKKNASKAAVNTSEKKSVPQTRETKKTKVKSGRLHIMRSTKTATIYLGQTTTTVGRRFSHHKGVSKIGRRGALYDAMRMYGHDTFSIAQLGPDIEIPAGEKPKVFLKTFEDKACQEHIKAGFTLFNHDVGTEESKESSKKKLFKTLAAKTPEQKRQKIERSQETKKQRGVNRGRIEKRCNDEYVLIYQKNKKEIQMRFLTQHDAKAAQDRMFPKRKRLPPGSKISYVYAIRNPKSIKWYAGKTKTPLPSRMSNHRALANDEKDPFHLQLRSDPDGWQIFPIYVLYNVTAEELSAVETWTISQNLESLWNKPERVRKPFLYKYWYYRYGKKSKKFYLSHGKSKEDAKQLAIEFQASNPGGTLNYVEQWTAALKLGKKIMTHSCTDKKEADAWMTRMLVERAAATAKLAQEVINVPQNGTRI